MDIEYIKMCKKARKVQENWNPQEGDFAIQVNDDETIENIHCIGILKECYPKSLELIRSCKCTNDLDYPQRFWIWLPRQDQLQEMSGLPWDLYYFDILNNYSEYDSAEKAGLAMIMYTQHRCAKWDGKTWVRD